MNNTVIQQEDLSIEILHCQEIAEQIYFDSGCEDGLEVLESYSQGKISLTKMKTMLDEISGSIY
jgi:hypothetical protein